MGFLDSPADGQGEYTEEEIAEQIFDWWVSARPFDEWYAEKFLQQKLDFKDEVDILSPLKE